MLNTKRAGVGDRRAHRLRSWPVVLGCAALLLGACGTSPPTSVSAAGGATTPTTSPGPPSTIGDLEPSDVHGADTSGLPPLNEDLHLIACSQFAALTGHQPYYPTNVPPSAGRPLCDLQQPPGMALNTTGRFVAGLVYVPPSMSPTANTWDQIIAAGGVDIEQNFNLPPRSVTLPTYQPSQFLNPSTGHRHAMATTIRGRYPAIVGRTTPPDHVGVYWIEPDTTAAPVGFNVITHLSPDETYSIAQSLTPGVPPNELPLPPPPAPDPALQHPPAPASPPATTTSPSSGPP
ncbi:MAG: hypothetical protein ACYDH6_23475 [Acidimicrobiales bacterium]